MIHLLNAPGTTEDDPLLWLGTDVDGGRHGVPLSVMLRHFAVLGASGSGKTVACKVIVEEAVRYGVPVIAIDPQGDIASLGLRGNRARFEAMGTEWPLAADFYNKLDFKVWTPGSQKGLPISMVPNLNFAGIQGEEKLRVMANTARALTGLAGYKAGGYDAAVAGFNMMLEYVEAEQLAIDTLEDFMALLSDPPGPLAYQLEPIFGEKERAAAAKRFLIKMKGPHRALLSGAPIDVNTLFGYEPGGPADNLKVRVSVIYLNTLTEQEDKELFVATLCNAIYGWMLQEPSTMPVGLVYLDEAAPYLPPVRKPVSKEPLSLLMRQARKYGVSMLVATQSPGDLDYKALGQVGTRLLGRMSSAQEAYKVLPYFTSAEQSQLHDVLDVLPKLKARDFLLSSPDVYEEPVAIQTRYLVTEHRTLEPEALPELLEMHGG